MPQVCSCGLGAGATWDVAQLEDPAAVRRVIAKLRRRGPPAAFEGWGPARNASLEAALLEPTLHSGHSRRSAQRLFLHYTPALAALAAELYAADVSRFGYARDVAAFSVRLGAFRSCLGLASSAAPVDEMLHGGGRPRWSAARIGDCAANASFRTGCSPRTIVTPRITAHITNDRCRAPSHEARARSIVIGSGPSVRGGGAIRPAAVRVPRRAQHAHASPRTVLSSSLASPCPPSRPSPRRRPPVQVDRSGSVQPTKETRPWATKSIQMRSSSLPLWFAWCVSSM